MSSKEVSFHVDLLTDELRWIWINLSLVQSYNIHASWAQHPVSNKSHGQHVLSKAVDDNAAPVREETKTKIVVSRLTVQPPTIQLARNLSISSFFCIFYTKWIPLSFSTRDVHSISSLGSYFAHPILNCGPDSSGKKRSKLTRPNHWRRDFSPTLDWLEEKAERMMVTYILGYRVINWSSPALCKVEFNSSIQITRCMWALHQEILLVYRCTQWPQGSLFIPEPLSNWYGMTINGSI